MAELPDTPKPQQARLLDDLPDAANAFPSAPSVPARTSPEKITPARRRGGRPSVVERNPRAIEVLADSVTQSIMRALLDGEDYTQDPEQGVAEFKRPLGDRGEIVIRVTPGHEETWEQVLMALRQLGDEVVDTFCAVLTLALDKNGSQHITQPFYVDPYDILQICQRQLSNRAYTPQQKHAIIDNLNILARPLVTASVPGRRRGREVRFESAIVDLLSDRIGEYQIETGEVLWQQRQIKIGDWARIAPPLTGDTALLLRQVLKYHAQRDRVAKRLGRYLSLQFRQLPLASLVSQEPDEAEGTHQADVALEYELAALLQEAGIRPDLKNPGRTRTMIENAFRRLKNDGVIGPYTQVVEGVEGSYLLASESSKTDSAERLESLDGDSGADRAVALRQAHADRVFIEQKGYGWWDVYARQRWRFYPPQHEAQLPLAFPSHSSSTTADVEGDDDAEPIIVDAN